MSDIDEYRQRLVHALRVEADEDELQGFAEFVWYRQMADRIEAGSFPPADHP